MTTAVFDLGGVVVLWDPVPAIAAVVGEPRANHFVHGSEFDFTAWNHAQDSGRSWADAEAAATADHPELAEEIAAYRPNFALSLRGLVPGTAEILRSLHERGVRLVALTNWSAETIHHGPEAFPEVFDLFDDIVVSGAEGVAKPDREIFRSSPVGLSTRSAASSTSMTTHETWTPRAPPAWTRSTSPTPLPCSRSSRGAACSTSSDPLRAASATWTSGRCSMCAWACGRMDATLFRN